MKKKYLATIFAAITSVSCVLGFTACEGGKDNGNDTDPPTHTEHTYTETVIDPTCTAHGYTLHTCTCGESYKDNYKPTVSHNFIDGVCKNCGALLPTENLLYNLNDDGESYSVSGCFQKDANIVIPLEYEGKPVTSIGESAFRSCKNITSLIIPDSITSISEYAFAFCENLTSIAIPDGVSAIGALAFVGCTSLISITIPDSVTSIGYGAFDDCGSLTSLSVPFIGADIAGTDNTHFGYIFGASKYGSNKWAVPQSLKSVIITGVINSVSEYAFSGCEYITNITLPDGLKSIGGSAFNDCSALTDINIPDSMTYIGDYAFDDCTYLNYRHYGNCRYLGNDNNPYLVLMSSVSKHTTNCTIHKDTRIIYFNTFLLCEQLTSAIISDGVPYIGKGMFKCCMKLKSVTIPDSITFIDEYAFFYCESLTSIIIPDSVTSIGNYAFAYCYLTDIYFKGSEQQWAAIQMGSSNECLNIATIHYNYNG